MDHVEKLRTLCAVLASVSACGGGSTPRDVPGAGGSVAVGSGGSSSIVAGSTTGSGGGSIITPPEGGLGGASGHREGGTIIGMLPPDFTKAEAGGYKLGQPIMGAGLDDTGVGGNGVCNEIAGVVRDFRGYDVGGHPDFQRFGGEGTKGLVETTLGVDAKPVYTGACETPNVFSAACPYGQATTGKANFDQWYRYTEGINKPYVLYFFLEPMPGQSVVSFNSQFFFPVDAAGWQAPGALGGDMPNVGDDGRLHNFNFTTEVHTKFEYTGGETFRFEGDDDLWVFVNRKLAIDLGGIHSAETATISLDALAPAFGLTKGTIYPLDLFQAERHSTGSHYHFDTTLSFVDCGSIPPDVPR